MIFLKQYVLVCDWKWFYPSLNKKESLLINQVKNNSLYCIPFMDLGEINTEKHSIAEKIKVKARDLGEE